MNVLRRAAILAASASLAFAAPAFAQNYPLAPGEFVSVTMITIDDGHGLDYAQFLSGQWKEQEEFAKAQGWISSYEILQNIDKRPGEPDIYLVAHMKSIPDAAEQARREDVIRARTRMTDAQMEAGSGDRAKYRHVIGSMMLQELKFK
jgi:hypothetical protein